MTLTKTEISERVQAIGLAASYIQRRINMGGYTLPEFSDDMTKLQGMTDRLHGDIEEEIHGRRPAQATL